MDILRLPRDRHHREDKVAGVRIRRRQHGTFAALPKLIAKKLQLDRHFLVDDPVPFPDLRIGRNRVKSGGDAVITDDFQRFGAIQFEQTPSTFHAISAGAHGSIRFQPDEPFVESHTTIHREPIT
jgi:hypothetical protein